MGWPRVNAGNSKLNWEMRNQFTRHKIEVQGEIKGAVGGFQLKIAQLENQAAVTASDPDSVRSTATDGRLLGSRIDSLAGNLKKVETAFGAAQRSFSQIQNKFNQDDTLLCESQQKVMAGGSLGLAPGDLFNFLPRQLDKARRDQRPSSAAKGRASQIVKRFSY